MPLLRSIALLVVDGNKIKKEAVIKENSLFCFL